MSRNEMLTLCTTPLRIPSYQHPPPSLHPLPPSSSLLPPSQCMQRLYKVYVLVTQGDAHSAQSAAPSPPHPFLSTSPSPLLPSPLFSLSPPSQCMQRLNKVNVLVAKRDAHTLHDLLHPHRPVGLALDPQWGRDGQQKGGQGLGTDEALSRVWMECEQRVR